MSFRLSLWPKLVRFVDNFKIISLLIIIFKTHFKITFNPFAHIRSSFQLIFYMRRNNYRIIHEILLNIVLIKYFERTYVAKWINFEGRERNQTSFK